MHDLNIGIVVFPGSNCDDDLVHVLEDAGVYKCTAEGREAFMRFINKL
jgi:galactose-1-phosphate uridylyltransferase